MYVIAQSSSHPHVFGNVFLVSGVQMPVQYVPVLCERSGESSSTKSLYGESS